VRIRRVTIGAAAALTVVAALVAASVGSAKSAATFRVAVVTDIGSIQDKGFNELANKGRLVVEKKWDNSPIPVDTRLFVTKTAADRLPNLQAAAQQGYNLIFGVGFLMFEPLNVVAPAFPTRNFAGIDVTKFLLESDPKNYTGIQFAEHEAGYLVGFLAGLQVKRQGGKQIISAVGANNVPPILKFASGYVQGAKRANPQVKVLWNLANDPTFSDQAKCKEQALRQIAKGSQVVFQIAGQCGLGALSAAKEKKVWGIGVDADQSFLGAHMLTSALKKVDRAVISLTGLARAGRLPQQTDVLYTVKNGGVGLGKISPRVNKADIAKAKGAQRSIAFGRIKVKDLIKLKPVN
jgi:basic membrane protein A